MSLAKMLRNIKWLQSKKFSTGPIEQTHPPLRNDRVSRGGSLAAGVELSPPLQKPHPRLRNDRVSRGGIGVLDLEGSVQKVLLEIS